MLAASKLLFSDGLISVDELYDYIGRHQENVLLILDGYDEYVYTAENQSLVLKIWNKNQLGDCCVLLTSRQMKAERFRSSSDAIFKIDGFNPQRQAEFSRRFLIDDEDIAEFFKYLTHHNLSELAQIPLLLMVLCLLWRSKDSKALPKERADIFIQFVKTLFHHMLEKQSVGSAFVKEDDYSNELCALGRLAFEALWQGHLCFPVSQLPDYSAIERLIEVGLFQLLNLSSVNPKKGVYFIHKSLQAFLAAYFLNEELLPEKGESNVLEKVESVETIFRMGEVLEFACELSEKAARKILSHLEMVAEKETSAEVSHFIGNGNIIN